MLVLLTLVARFRIKEGILVPTLRVLETFVVRENWEEDAEPEEEDDSGVSIRKTC